MYFMGGDIVHALFSTFFVIKLTMLFAKARNCLKVFLFVFLSLALSNWQFILASKIEFFTLKIENLTALEPVQDGRYEYNVTIRWQVKSFNRTNTPLFKIWLTINDEIVRNVSVLDSTALNETWFEYKFIRLGPVKHYVAHVEAYFPTQNISSCESIKFDIKPAIVYKDVLTTNVSAERGYLIINWIVPKKHRHSSTPITYNINLCNEGVPIACNVTFTVCKATYYYNDSTNESSGQIDLYEENWRRYIKNKTQMQTPLLKRWESQDYQFSCSIYLGVCINKLAFRQTLLYKVDYGNGNYGIQTDKVIFQKGFSYKPEFINISFSTPPGDPNRITAKVHWRFPISCRSSPAVNIRILLSGIKTNLEKNFHKFEFISFDSNIIHADKETLFPNLVPYSYYTLQFITDNDAKDAKSRVTTVKDFTTPHGVPTASPTIQPIVSGVGHCSENKRNVTVMWTPLPVKSRNGIIRNMTVKYFTNESDPQLIFLPNVTSTVIFGLDCDVEYQVQVRACMYVNESCSPYSDSQVIAIPFKDDETQTSDGRTVPIWVIVLVSCVGFVAMVVALVICQYIYRRKKRTPLEQLRENLGCEYEIAEKKDLSILGIYNDVDEGRHTDPVGSRNSETLF